MKTALDKALVEKDVENVYRAEIQRLRSEASITSPHGSDGYAQWGTVRLLLEAKYDLDFKKRLPVCNTLGQALMYIKKFETSGEPMPNVILVGDKNECFVLSTASVKGFLDLSIDWEVAPSKGNPELVRALVDGLNILPWVYDIDDHFDMRKLLDKVDALASGLQPTVRATRSNISAIFTYWSEEVFQDKELTAVEKADLFLKCLFKPNDVYLHPGKRNILIAPGYEVVVNADLYKSFFAQYEQGYKPSEVRAFLADRDRLIEDDARRRQGAFYTPALWVDEAHKEIAKVLGEDWKETCIVWDNSAGTGNLTRVYVFSDLILSTAEKPDVETIINQGYNPGSSVFQYDFLNPEASSPFFEDEESVNEIPAEVHERLKAAAKAGKRLVFFMNPPYGTAGNNKFAENKKAGITQTVVNENMNKAKLGTARQQLYAQFIFESNRLAKVYGFEKHVIAQFTTSNYITGSSYKRFRQWFYNHYKFESGFLFQASHFADVSDSWGIAFTVWDSEGRQTNPDLHLELKDTSNFNVGVTGNKTVYNADDRQASGWVRKPLGRQAANKEVPFFSSGLKYRDKGYGSLYEGSLGYMHNDSNNVGQSATLVGFYSSAFTNGHGLSIQPSNWRRAVALFTARKLVANNWMNNKDEYLIPTPSDDYEQWVDDAHVFALLHSSNNATSLRDITAHGKTWDIHNHFFWMTHEEALEAYDTSDTHELYKDASNNPSKDIWGNPVESTPDPYWASQLPELNLSKEAQDCLDRIKDLFTKSLPYRENYAAAHPELHLLSWDAGVYQLKYLWRDMFPEEYEALREAYRTLETKLRPGVYEHGFLLD